MNKILVVEDDSPLRKYLRELLLENQFQAQTSPDGIAALDVIEKTPPDLVILDLGLPNMSGESVLQEIRKRNANLPVIILTAKDSTSDIVEGLNIGADDYITKPFVADELLARIKVRLRKNGEDKSKLSVADLEVDTQTFQVKRAGQDISLTPQEFKLLEYLMRNKGRVLTREMILNRVWSYSQEVETRVVDVYIGYLRKKICYPFNKKLISSIRGFGYMIRE